MVEFYNAINTFVGNSVFLLVSFLGALIGSGMTGYIQERGKNAALMKELAKMTEIVEGVKNEYNLLIEEIRSRNSLKMAAIDKRLEVHQQVYAYWIEIGSVFNQEFSLLKIVERAQEYLHLNSLYLDPTVLSNYDEMLFLASQYHNNLIKINQGDDSVQKQNADFLELLMSMGNIIREAVTLPGLNEDQIKLNV